MTLAVLPLQRGLLVTLISSDTLEAVTDTLVGVGETASLEHLILVLEEQLDTLNGGSSGLGDSGGDTTLFDPERKEGKGG